MSACGDEKTDATDASSLWRHATLDGVSGASGVAVVDDTLFVCAGGGVRTLFAVSLSELRDGRTVAPRVVPIEIPEDDVVIGYDDVLAQRGTTLGDLWKADVDLQAIAAQDPDYLFVGDRAHRVVYWGRMRREIGGRVAGLRIQYAFIPPGAKRTQSDRADFRDHGPGIAGLSGVRGRKTEDLYLVERAHGGSGDPQHDFRVLLLDRFGRLGQSGFFVVHVTDEGPPAVEGISAGDDRYLFLRGNGRGAIAPVIDPGLMRRTNLGRSTPGPAIDGAGDWRGMAHGPDGSLYLVSNGSPGVVAWRAP